MMDHTIEEDFVILSFQVMEDSFQIVEWFTKEIGKIVNLRVLENNTLQMAIHMKAFLWMEWKREKASSGGATERSMKECFKMARWMVEANFTEGKNNTLRDNSKIIKKLEAGNWKLLMAFMMGHLRMDSLVGKERLCGMIKRYMKENSRRET